MCVIAVAAKKRHMKREEVLEAIKHNSAGFFGFTVHDSARRTIRTLDDKEFMDFFDSVDDDDVWIMHARIPSRGEKNLANVHGWEEDGIVFSHNMTISDIDGMMKNVKWEGTDSEFFFRHIFMPFYRGCGPDAYKDGRFCQDLDNLVRHFCGYSNKFLFIMPDNRVVRYGQWVEEKDRKENGECAFYASNSSYKVYTPAWPAAGRTETAGSGGARPVTTTTPYSWDWDDEYERYGDPYAAPAVAGGKLMSDDEDVVELVWDTLGPERLVRIALCDLVSRNVMNLRSLPGDWNGCSATESVDDVALAMEDLLPDAFTDNTYCAVADALGMLGPKYGPVAFARDYAKEFATSLMFGTLKTHKYLDDDDVEDAVKETFATWRAYARIAGLAMNFDAKSPGALACVTDMTFGKSGWKVTRASVEDTLVPDTMGTQDALKAVGMLLDYLAEASEKTPERSAG